MRVKSITIEGVQTNVVLTRVGIHLVSVEYTDPGTGWKEMFSVHQNELDVAVYHRIAPLVYGTRSFTNSMSRDMADLISRLFW